MIVQDYNSTHVENKLLRQIQVKEHQLKIAQEFNMVYVAERLQSQLLELQTQVSESQDLQFQALMSLVDDWD